VNRVMVARPYVNICTMQVCAVKGSTDEEILKCCNIDNVAGTARGWLTVHREIDPDNPFMDEHSLPCQCHDHPDREHILVSC
jgi:hypothetical protein